jgi:hypothetical protein
MRIDRPLKAQDKQQCKRGHWFKDTGFYYHVLTGQLECKQCKTDSNRKRYDKLKQAAETHKAELEAIVHQAAIDAGLVPNVADIVPQSQEPVDQPKHDPYHDTAEYKLDCVIGQAVDKALSEGKQWTPELQRTIEQQFGLK